MEKTYYRELNMRIFYCIYQIVVCVPMIILSTIITSLTTIIGCALGDGNFWSYYPPCLWSRFNCWICLLPVKVTGRENLDPNQSYVFVSNHQGIFDIWMIYGFLGRNFKWMMKPELRKIPFMGKACESANHLYVNRGDKDSIMKTYDRARSILRSGMSLCVFPEGSRTKTGQLGVFKKGAYLLAEDIKLPIAPLTINGSYDVLPNKGLRFIRWHRLSLTIHKPIPYDETKDIKTLIEESRTVIASALK